MLDRPKDGRNVQKLLELADYLERDITFDMTDWRYCICGNYLRMTGRDFMEEGIRRADPMMSAIKELGLRLEHGIELFLGQPNRDARQAARVVRHLALTGEVDWTVKEKELVEA